MFKKIGREPDFFDGLCAQYYEKILRYLFVKLQNEPAARDAVQDVFLLALEKKELLARHPNPGGFLFQTAKNIARAKQRESFRRMLRESPGDGEEECAASPDTVEEALDRKINEDDYIEEVLSQLSGEKRRLYTLYYLEKKSMREIAKLLKLEETALRMRYVRLRREIRSLAAGTAEKYFDL